MRVKYNTEKHDANNVFALYSDNQDLTINQYHNLNEFIP